MSEKVARTGIKREKGFLYFIGQDGNVWKVGARGGPHAGTPKHRVAFANVQKDKRYMYFLDKDGDIGRQLLKRKTRQ